MEFWETILTSILIITFVPVILLVVGLIKIFEEKKLSSTETIKTRPPKIISVLLLCFAFLVICCGIAVITYLCIKENDSIMFIKVIITSVITMIFVLIGLLTYAVLRFNCVIADYNGIYVFSLFRKTKHFRYDEICYFEHTFGVGVYRSFVAFDNFNNIIFSINSSHTGIYDIAEILSEYGVEDRSADILQLWK